MTPPSSREAILLLGLLAATTVSSVAALSECPPLVTDPCLCRENCIDLLFAGGKVCFVDDPVRCPRARSLRSRDEAYVICEDPVNCTGSWTSYSPCEGEPEAGNVGEQCKEYRIATQAANGGEQCPQEHCARDCRACKLEPVFQEQEICEGLVQETPGSLSIPISSRAASEDGPATDAECRSFLLSEGSRRARQTLKITETEGEVNLGVLRKKAAAMEDDQGPAPDGGAALTGPCTILTEGYQCKDGTAAGTVSCGFKTLSLEKSCTNRQVCVKYC